VGDDVSVDSETLLMTDFVNLKIKLTQSFGCAHEDKVCVHIFREVNTGMCIRIYVCIIFLIKKYSRFCETRSTKHGVLPNLFLMILLTTRGRGVLQVYVGPEQDN
jgi:hypothetical protein